VPGAGAEFIGTPPCFLYGAHGREPTLQSDAFSQFNQFGHVQTN
jgi:hypothetical protein